MSTKFTCRFCNEQFDVPKGLYKHLQLVHNAGVSRDSRTCPICGVLCSKYESYRDHLLYIHGQTDDGQKLTFKSLNEFLVWKAELELKHNCKYVLQTTPKVLPTKEKKYFYKCDRSNSKSKDKKSSMSVIMKTCSSVISVVEGAGAFKVEYWDTHSGHEPAATSLQSELEAAISSVEMVNAIGDSDDSFDRSEELFIPESPSISNIEKPTLFIKTNSPANVNKSPVVNTFLKAKTIQSLGKLDSAKKNINSKAMSFSLASVACGKGIVKKPAVKSNENKSADSLSTLKPDLKIDLDNSISNSSSSAVKEKDDPASKEPVTANKPDESTVTTTSSSSSVTTKTTSSGPTTIAPKIPSATNNTMNPLFPANNSFSNQFVIMSPASVGQNSLTSSPNVFTAGQNILFSLGSLGQNTPLTSTSQTSTPISATEVKKGAAVSKTKGEKRNASKVYTPAKKSFSNAQKVSSVMTSTITSNSAVTLTPGMNAPVILSSLPVGSTFMSVNNNFIPIASPSGAYIPNNLPPNIVLTPVVPGSNMSKLNSSKTTTSSSNTLTITPIPATDVKKTSVSKTKGEISTSKVPASSKNIPSQVRFTTPSTVAITVSSIVKEPLYTSSTIKHMSNIITSSASPIVSTASKNSRQRSQNKYIPITTASRVSPVKSIDKSLNSPKGSSNANKSKNSPNSIADKAEINSTPSAKKSASKVNSYASNKSVSVASSAINMYTSTPKSKTSARKGMTKSASPIITPGNNFLSNFNTNVVNSRLHLKPISSTPNVKMAPQLNTQKPGTMLFESAAGDIYMLEPIENVEISTEPKKVPVAETPKIKVDRSVQTTENSSLSILRSKLQRKRASPPTDDSAVMLKVKCYQLEMKCLNSQAQCKRLKVELTKERLRNAELSGKKASENLDDDTLNESITTNAAEIMKEIEDKFSETKEPSIYTMTKTSVLRSLYEDLEGVCVENGQLCKELENYRAHDKFYKSLKKRLNDEEF